MRGLVLPEKAGPAHPWAGGERLRVEVPAGAVVLDAPAGARLSPGDGVAGLSVWGALAEQVVGIPRHTVLPFDRADEALGVIDRRGAHGTVVALAPGRDGSG